MYLVIVGPPYAMDCHAPPPPPHTSLFGVGEKSTVGRIYVGEMGDREKGNIQCKERKRLKGKVRYESGKVINMGWDGRRKGCLCIGRYGERYKE